MATFEESGLTADEVSTPAAVEEPAAPASTGVVLPPGVYSEAWAGRPLQTPIENTKYGQEYLRVKERNFNERAGFLESIVPSWADVPFLGDVVDAKDLLDVPAIAERVRNDQPVTDDELTKLNLFMEEADRVKNRSWMGDVAAGLKGLVTFGTEFLLTSAVTTPAGGAAKIAQKFGTRGAFAALGGQMKMATRDLVKKAWGEKAGSKILTDLAGGVSDFATRGAAMTAVDSAIDKLASVGMGMENDYSRAQAYRELEQVYEGKPVNRELAWWAEAGNRYFDYMTEFSGPYLGKTVVGIGNKLRPGTFDSWKAYGEAMGKWLDEADPKLAGTAAGVKKLAQNKGVAGAGAYLMHLMQKHPFDGGTIAYLAEKGGYDGFLEEVGEERLGGFLTGLFGLQGDDWGLRNAFDQMIPPMHDLSVELATFAMPGAIASGTHAIVNSKWAGGQGIGYLAKARNDYKRMMDPTILPTGEKALAESDAEFKDKVQGIMDLGVAHLRARDAGPRTKNVFRSMLDTASRLAHFDILGAMYSNVDEWAKANSYEYLPLQMMEKRYDEYLKQNPGDVAGAESYASSELISDLREIRNVVITDTAEQARQLQESGAVKAGPEGQVLRNINVKVEEALKERLNKQRINIELPKASELLAHLEDVSISPEVMDQMVDSKMPTPGMMQALRLNMNQPNALQTFAEIQKFLSGVRKAFGGSFKNVSIGEGKNKATLAFTPLNLQYQGDRVEFENNPGLFYGRTFDEAVKESKEQGKNVPGYKEGNAYNGMGAVMLGGKVYVSLPAMGVYRDSYDNGLYHMVEDLTHVALSVNDNAIFKEGTATNAFAKSVADMATKMQAASTDDAEKKRLGKIVNILNSPNPIIKNEFLTKWMLHQEQGYVHPSFKPTDFNEHSLVWSDLTAQLGKPSDYVAQGWVPAYMEMMRGVKEVYGADDLSFMKNPYTKVSFAREIKETAPAKEEAQKKPEVKTETPKAEPSKSLVSTMKPPAAEKPAPAVAVKKEEVPSASEKQTPVAVAGEKPAGPAAGVAEGKPGEVQQAAVPGQVGKKEVKSSLQLLEEQQAEIPILPIKPPEGLAAAPAATNEPPPDEYLVSPIRPGGMDVGQASQLAAYDLISLERKEQIVRHLLKRTDQLPADKAEADALVRRFMLKLFREPELAEERWAQFEEDITQVRLDEEGLTDNEVEDLQAAGASWQGDSERRMELDLNSRLLPRLAMIVDPVKGRSDVLNFFKSELQRMVSNMVDVTKELKPLENETVAAWDKRVKEIRDREALPTNPKSLLIDTPERFAEWRAQPADENVRGEKIVKFLSESLTFADFAHDYTVLVGMVAMPSVDIVVKDGHRVASAEPVAGVGVYEQTLRQIVKSQMQWSVPADKRAEKFKALKASWAAAGVSDLMQSYRAAADKDGWYKPFCDQMQMDSDGKPDKAARIQARNRRLKVCDVLEKLSGIPAERFGEALLASRGETKTTNFDLRHMLEQVDWSLRFDPWQDKSFKDLPTDAETRWNAWLDKIRNDAFLGGVLDGASKHVNSPLTKLAKSAKISWLEKYVEPGMVAGVTETSQPTSVYLSPAVWQIRMDMERARRGELDDSIFKDAHMVKMLAVSDWDGKNVDASRLSTGENGSKFESLYQYSQSRPVTVDADGKVAVPGRMFIDINAGVRTWIMGLDIPRPLDLPAYAKERAAWEARPDVKAMPMDAKRRSFFEENYRLAREWLDTAVVGGLEKNWAGDIIIMFKRFEGETSPGRPALSIQGGLPVVNQVAVMDIPGSDGAIYFDESMWEPMAVSFGLVDKELLDWRDKWQSLSEGERLQVSKMIGLRWNNGEPMTPKDAVKKLKHENTTIKAYATWRDISTGAPIMLKGNFIMLDQAYVKAMGDEGVAARVAKAMKPHKGKLLLVASKDSVKTAFGKRAEDIAGTDSIDMAKAIWMPIYAMGFQTPLSSDSMVKNIQAAWQSKGDMSAIRGAQSLFNLMADASSSEAEYLKQYGKDELENIPMEHAGVIIQSMIDAGIPASHPSIALEKAHLKSVAIANRVGRLTFNGTNYVHVPSLGSPYVRESSKSGDDRTVSALVVAHLQSPGVRYGHFFETKEVAINWIVKRVMDGECLDLVSWNALDPKAETPDAMMRRLNGAGDKLAAEKEIKSKLRDWEITEMIDPETKTVRTMVPGTFFMFDRTPGTSPSSHIGARLTIDPGEAFGNRVMIHQNTIDAAGIDYDGDKAGGRTFRFWKNGSLIFSPFAVDGTPLFEKPETQARARAYAAANRVLAGVMSLYDSAPANLLKARTTGDYYTKQLDGPIKKVFTSLQAAMLASLKDKNGVWKPKAKAEMDKMSHGGKSALGAWVNSAGLSYALLFNTGIKLKAPNARPVTLRHKALGNLGYVYNPEMLEWDQPGQSVEDSERNLRKARQYQRLFNLLTNQIVDDPKTLATLLLGISRERASMLEFMIMGASSAHILGETEAEDDAKADEFVNLLLKVARLPVFQKVQEVYDYFNRADVSDQNISPDAMYEILSGQQRIFRDTPQPYTRTYNVWRAAHPLDAAVDPNGTFATFIQHLMKTNMWVRNLGNFYKIGYRGAADLSSVSKANDASIRMNYQSMNAQSEGVPRGMKDTLFIKPGVENTANYRLAMTTLGSLWDNVFNNEHPYVKFGLLEELDTALRMDLDVLHERDRKTTPDTKIADVANALAKVTGKEAKQWIPGMDLDDAMLRGLSTIAIKTLRNLPGVSDKVKNAPVRSLAYPLRGIIRALETTNPAVTELLQVRTWTIEDQEEFLAEVGDNRRYYETEVAMKYEWRQSDMWTPTFIDKYRQSFEAIPDVELVDGKGNVDKWTSRDIKVALMLSAVRQFGLNAQGRIAAGNFQHVMPVSLHTELAQALETAPRMEFGAAEVAYMLGITKTYAVPAVKPAPALSAADQERVALIQTPSTDVAALVREAAPPAQFAPKELAKAAGAKWVLAAKAPHGGFATRLATAAEKRGLLINADTSVSAGDTVYVSVPGANRGFVMTGGTVYAQIPRLLDAGAVIRTDNAANATRSHNAEGEGKLRTSLLDSGYVETPGPFFSEWRKEPGRPVTGAQSPTFTDEMRAELIELMRISDDDRTDVQNERLAYLETESAMARAGGGAQASIIPFPTETQYPWTYGNVATRTARQLFGEDDNLKISKFVSRFGQQAQSVEGRLNGPDLERVMENMNWPPELKANVRRLAARPYQQSGLPGLDKAEVQAYKAEAAQGYQDFQEFIAPWGLQDMTEDPVQKVLDEQDRAVMASLRTPQQTLDLNTPMSPGGTAAMHQLFMDDMKKLAALNHEDAEMRNFMARYFGNWDRDYIEKYEDTTRTNLKGETVPAKFFTKPGLFRKAQNMPWTETDKQDVGNFMAIVSALVESSQFRHLLAKSNGSHKAATEIAAKVMPSLKIAWGHNFTDLSGREVQNLESVEAAWLRFEGSTGAQKLRQTGRDVGREMLARTAVNFIERFDARQAAFKEVLGKRAAYLPHVFGHGTDGSHAIREARDRVHRILNKQGKINAADTMLPSGAEYETPKNNEAPPPPTQAQKDLLRVIDPVFKKLDPGASLDDHMEGWTVFDADEAIRSALLDQEYDASLSAGEAYVADPVRIRTIAKLATVLANNSNYTWSRHAESRRLDAADYADAFNKYQLKPATLDIMEIWDKYAKGVNSAMTRRMLLSRMAVQKDVDGRPMVLVVPTEVAAKTKGQLARAAISPKILMESARQFAQYYNVKLPPLNSDNVGKVLRELATNGILPAEAYEVLPSPFMGIGEFRVLKGDASSVMKHLVLEPRKWMVGDTDVLAQLMRITQWTKMMSVGWSLFFPLSLMESVVAGTGIRQNVLKEFIPHPLKFIQKLKDIRKEMDDPKSYWSEILAEFTAAGIEFGRENVTDKALGVVDKDLARAGEWVRLNYGKEMADRFAKFSKVITGRWMSERFFGDMFPVIKLWAAERLAKEIAHAKGLNWETQRVEVLKQVAPAINDAYGGQFWARYLWANPRTMQTMNLLWFAPNWTLSSWNQAGGGLITNKLIGNTISDEQLDFIFKKNWPAMLLIVLGALPAATQGAIWAITRPMGGDPEDVPFPWMNELGRQTYVDITPLTRLMPGYTGEPTGKRRDFMRWGKQAWEVLDGWMTEPASQFLRKLSQPARLVVEEVTGRSPGSDWNLEFQGKGMAGWLMSDKEGVEGLLTGRLGYAAQKFLPMSFVQTLKNPALGILPTLAPMSKGKSMGMATKDFQDILMTYADDEAYNFLQKNPAAYERLKALAPQLLEAAELNGYDVKKIVNSAKGTVLSGIYKHMWEALNRGDEKEAERRAYQALRVGGSIQGAFKSMKNRATNYGVTVTPEMQEAIDEAFKRGGATKK